LTNLIQRGPELLLLYCLQQWDFFTVWRGQFKALSLTNLIQRGPELLLHSIAFNGDCFTIWRGQSKAFSLTYLIQRGPELLFISLLSTVGHFYDLAWPIQSTFFDESESTWT
jgi:hypothetical protein